MPRTAWFKWPTAEELIQINPLWRRTIKFCSGADLEVFRCCVSSESLLLPCFLFSRLRSLWLLSRPEAVAEVAADTSEVAAVAGDTSEVAAEVDLQAGEASVRVDLRGVEASMADL
jgi:hypothetical protein